MLVNSEDLVRALEDKGGSLLESFLKDLLVLEGQAVGIPPTKIDWDHRTSVRDGGRDIVVHAGCSISSSLIPAQPSIWSAKSGKDGTSATSLKREVLDHPKVVTHLNDGNCYRSVVLQPCDHDKRDELRDQARKLEEERRWSAGSIELVFVDQLATRASACPTLIPHHVRDVALRLGPGATAAEGWSATLRKGKASFAQLASREALFQKLIAHLNNVGESNLIHVGGWSGVGKSRLVAEAVSHCHVPDAITVYQKWEDFDKGLHPSLRSGQIDAASLIIDEVEPRHLADLAELCRVQEGLKVVSIGVTDDAERHQRFVHILSRPVADELSAVVVDLLGYDDDQLVGRIAHLSDGDFRLAELLCFAARDLGGAGASDRELIAALRDLGSFLTRYLHLNKEIVQQPASFRHLLSVLCVLADVGRLGAKSNELEALSALLHTTRTELESAILKGKQIGLCREVGELVECVPRPLATYLFEMDGWPLIEARLLEFYEKLNSERARRAFLRRVEYCGDLKRGEVERQLGHLFRERFADATLADLGVTDTARTVRAFVETIPSIGLSWLRRLIDSASLESLLEFKGSTGMFGPSYGRREVVWLCEHLRAFSDCFHDAEAILFRLALAENEEIGNNATAEWCQCFWWMLSNTEVSYPDRVSLLIRRLRNATVESLPLLLNGVYGALHEPMSAIVPPEFVGGRLTPQEWRAKTWGEIFAQWERLMEAVFDLAANPQHCGRVVAFVIQNLSLLVRRGIPRRLRDEVLALDDLNEESLLALRRAIEQIVDRRPAMEDEDLDALQSWLIGLEPSSLESRLRDIVGRTVWDHRITARQRDEEDWREPYDRLAEAIQKQPDVLDRELDWLESKQAQSVRALGRSIAQNDDCERVLRDTVLKWLRSDRARDLITGYFIGLSEGDRPLPTWAADALEMLAEEKPDRVVELSVESDYSAAGVDRVLALLPSIDMPPSTFLHRMFGHRWEAVLTAANQHDILAALLSAEDDPNAIRTGLHLLWMWFKRMEDAPDEIEEVVGCVVQLAVDHGIVGAAHEWKEIAEWWGSRCPAKSAKLFLSVLCGIDSPSFAMRDEAEELLVNLARTSPEAVGGAIDDVLASKRDWVGFQVGVHRGLFERLGLDRVKRLVSRHGEDGAVAIARHLSDPDGADAGGVLEWFLKEWGDNERVFVAYWCGRHSGQVYSGHAFERRDAVYRRTEPFVNHPMPAYRKWAQWERKKIDQWAEIDRKRVEERGRE